MQIEINFSRIIYWKSLYEYSKQINYFFIVYNSWVYSSFAKCIICLMFDDITADFWWLMISYGW